MPSHSTLSRKFNTMYWVNTRDLRGFKSLFREILTAYSSQNHDNEKRNSKAFEACAGPGWPLGALLFVWK